MSQTRTHVRHQRILDAALNVFSRRGYSEAAVDDIASEAQTSKGGIYFHFPGKQAIFLALLDRSASLLLNRIADRVEAEPDPIAKVDVALDVLLRSFASHRVLARLFLVEAWGAGPEFHSKMYEIHGKFAAFIKQNLDDAVARGLISPVNTEIASLAWFGALNQVVVRWVLDEREYRLEDVSKTLRDVLLRSVAAPVHADLTESRVPFGGTGRDANGVFAGNRSVHVVGIGREGADAAGEQPETEQSGLQQDGAPNVRGECAREKIS